MNLPATIIKRLSAQYPQTRSALNYETPLDLLIAVILSAQCTDQRVNIVTKSLFRRYRRAVDYASADQQLLEQEIRPTGFYRNKAKNVLLCCQALVNRFNGEVPQTMEELISLNGVGRKTANCVLAEAFGIAAGIVVDTHVKRVAFRLDITGHSDPEKVEKDLMRAFPRKHWISAGNLLVYHGRNVCKARKPDCNNCVLNDCCPSSSIMKGQRKGHDRSNNST